MAAGIPVFSKNETSGSKIASGPSIRRGAGVPQLFADDCACTPYSRYLDDAFMIISTMYVLKVAPFPTLFSRRTP
ncbi:hypothetical protein ACEPAF_2705 [Sanghuangporus sanghuang]